MLGAAKVLSLEPAISFDRVRSVPVKGRSSGVFERRAQRVILSRRKRLAVGCEVAGSITGTESVTFTRTRSPDPDSRTEAPDWFTVHTPSWPRVKTLDHCPEIKSEHPST